MDTNLNILPISGPIEPLLEAYTESELAAAAGAYWNGKYFLSVYDSSEDEHRTYVWDTRIRLSWAFEKSQSPHPWWVWDLNCQCYQVLLGGSDRNMLYLGSRTAGLVYEYKQAQTHDNETAISCSWTSKPFDLRPRGLLKLFRSFSLRSYLSQNRFDVTLNTDEGHNLHSFGVIQPVSGALWGSAIWGLDKWGAGTAARDRENRRSLGKSLIGRTISVKITNSDKLSAWKIYSFGLLSKPKTVIATFRQKRV